MRPITRHLPLRLLSSVSFMADSSRAVFCRWERESQQHKSEFVREISLQILCSNFFQIFEHVLQAYNINRH